MDSGMSRFIMLQAMKMFDEYKDKEQITAEDIEIIQKKLSLYEQEAEAYKVQFTDDEQLILKEKTKEIIDRYKKSPKNVSDSEIIKGEVLSSQNIKIFDKTKDFFKNKVNLVKKKIAVKSEKEILEQEVIEIETPQNINISSKAKDFFKNKLTKIKEIDENTKEKMLNGGIVVTGIAIVVTTLATATVVIKSKDNKENEKEYEITQLGEQLQYTASNGLEAEEKINNIVIDKELEKNIDNEENEVSENKYFDVNSNTELVKRMSEFIVDCLSKGIAIKDVMTEEEINEANKNNVSFLSIEQLMDYYYVINIEDIDPIDYARLNYSTKTADTILNNYLACANVFTDDLLTAREDTTIDYSNIISDKESSNAVQTMADYIGKLNSSQNKSEIRKEITNYIEEEYIKKYDDLNSVSANEQIYRFMFSYDELTNGKGIPNDINIILNEDRTYSCSNTKEGYKNKSERAQDYTDVKNIIKDKLEISRDNINQDLSQITDNERKTGLELEKEIKETVLNMNPVFNINPEFKQETFEVSSKKSNSTKVSTSSVSTNIPSPVKGDNGLTIAQSEFDKYGIDSSTPAAKQEYETAVENNFKEEAAAKDTHVIKNNDGEVVVKGSEVDSSQYNHGYSDGYYDGNNKLSSSPYSSNTSYLSGYKEGYREGAKAREKLDRNYSFEKKEYYEDRKDKVVSEKESDITYNDYTSDPHVNENYSSNNTSISSDIEVKTEFVPLEEPEIVEENISEPTVEESFEEEITYEDYTDSEESRLETSSKQKLISEYTELKQILQSIDDVVDEAVNYKTI